MRHTFKIWGHVMSGQEFNCEIESDSSEFDTDEYESYLENYLKTPVRIDKYQEVTGD